MGSAVPPRLCRIEASGSRPMSQVTPTDSTKAWPLGRGVLHVEAEEGDLVTGLAMDLLQRRHLGLARHTGRREEVHDDRLAPVVLDAGLRPVEARERGIERLAARPATAAGDRARPAARTRPNTTPTRRIHTKVLRYLGDRTSRDDPPAPAGRDSHVASWRGGTPHDAGRCPDAHPTGLICGSLVRAVGSTLALPRRRAGCG